MQKTAPVSERYTGAVTFITGIGIAHSGQRRHTLEHTLTLRHLALIPENTDRAAGQNSLRHRGRPTNLFRRGVQDLVPFLSLIHI